MGRFKGLFFKNLGVFFIGLGRFFLRLQYSKLEVQNAEIFDPKKLISELPCHIYWLDSNLRYLGCNRQQAIACGLDSEKEIIGKKNSDFISDPKIVDILEKNNHQVMISRELNLFEEHFQTKPGQAALFLSHKKPIFDQNKNVIGLIGISMDITEKDEIQQKLKREKDSLNISFENIITNLPGNIFWLDRNNIFLGCNEAQAAAAGLKSRHEIVGKTNFDMPWKGHADHLNETNNYVMETGKEYSIEERGQMADGKESIFISKKVPYRDNHGKIIGTMGIAFDITERKQIEYDLKVAKNAAEIANRAKTDFLENMRHDIRTPLSGIIGLAELIQNEQDPDKVQHYWTQLSHSSRELLDFLNNILDSINIASGEIPLVKKRFDLCTVLQNVIALHQSKASEKNLALEFSFDPNIPKDLSGDPVRVYRIILEMLGNSLKFTQKGYVRVAAKLLKRTLQDIIVQIEVEDSGPGVPLEKQEELFIRFRRFIPSYQGIYKGTGLGLSIVKQFIDDLQGEVYYSQASQGGAKFISIIPLKQSLLDIDIETSH